MFVMYVVGLIRYNYVYIFLIMENNPGFYGFRNEIFRLGEEIFYFPRGMDSRAGINSKVSRSIDELVSIASTQFLVALRNKGNRGPTFSQRTAV